MKLTTILTVGLFVTTSAMAQQYATWVSALTGNDSFPCNRTQPCQTLQHAINMTLPFGTLTALDPIDSGPLTITVPITIRGNGSVITATSGTAISVTQGPTSPAGPSSFFDIFVQLELPPLTAGTGISTQTDLHLEDVRMNLTGASGGASSGSGTGLHVDGSQRTVHVNTDRHEVIGGNMGIHVAGGNLVHKNSTVKYAQTGILVESIPGRGASLWSQHSENSYNLQSGLTVDNTNGAGAVVRLSDSNLITGNFIGTQTISGGQIITLRDNDWAGNVTDGSTLLSASKR
jgi:hypothetical protein